MLILGLDPGTATTGFGLINAKKLTLEVLDFGLIKTDKNGEAAKRLVDIHRQVSIILKTKKPDVVAIEKLFFATNAKTAMSVGQAQGVMLFTAAKLKTNVIEYAPGTIKKVVAGDGRADKKMVQKSVRKLLGAKVRSKVHAKTHFDNAADALAVAICHAYHINGKIKKESNETRKGGDKGAI